MTNNNKTNEIASALMVAAQALSNVAQAMKGEEYTSRTKTRNTSAASEGAVAYGTEETPALPRPADLRERLEQALTRESLDTPRLSKTLGESVDKVEALLKSLRAEGKVANVGMGDAPIWSWKIGNNTETGLLRKVVKRLISERGMYLRELVAATGAKESRVSGVLIELQRIEKIVDLSGGQGHAKCYFLVSAGSHIDGGHDPASPIKSASLKPRGTTRAARAAKK